MKTILLKIFVKKRKQKFYFPPLCSRSDLLLFDFHNATHLKRWYEQSDNIRLNGRSSSTLELYRTKTDQILIFNSFLRPLETGEWYSGIRTRKRINLVGYKYISFGCKAYGNATTYKIILIHSHSRYPKTLFAQNFEVCLALFNV